MTVSCPLVPATDRQRLNDLPTGYLRRLPFLLILAAPFVGLALLRGRQLGGTVLTAVIWLLVAIVVLAPTGWALHLVRLRRRLVALIQSTQPVASVTAVIRPSGLGPAWVAELWLHDKSGRPDLTLLFALSEHPTSLDGNVTVWGELRPRAVVVVERDGAFLWPSTTALGKLRRLLLLGRR